MRSSDLTSASFRDDDVTVTDSRSIQLVFAPSGNICPSEAQFSRAMHLALSTPVFCGSDTIQNVPKSLISRTGQIKITKRTKNKYPVVKLAYFWISAPTSFHWFPQIPIWSDNAVPVKLIMSESRPEDEESLCTLYLFLANLRTIILSRFASELAESIFLGVNNGQERKGN